MVSAVAQEPDAQTRKHERFDAGVGGTDAACCLTLRYCPPHADAAPAEPVKPSTLSCQALRAMQEARRLEHLLGMAAAGQAEERMPSYRQMLQQQERQLEGLRKQVKTEEVAENGRNGGFCLLSFVFAQSEV